MRGRRIYAGEDGRLSLYEGDYGYQPLTGWVVRPPGCHAGGIPTHSITEHEDGTITVSPSIVLYELNPNGDSRVAWHGYLERGMWREV